MYRNYQYLKPHWQITTHELVCDFIPQMFHAHYPL